MAELVVLLMIVGPIYFIPFLAAKARHHNNAAAIGALNLFLGWTFIGWVVALVWSLTDNITKPVIKSQNY